MDQKETATQTPKGASEKVARHKRRFSWRRFGVVLLLIIGLLAIGRAILPWAVRRYVNRTLDRNPLYQGKIGDVTIHLWRGAYTIHDIRLLKTTGDVPVPLFDAKQVDLAIEWDAIMHGKIVGQVVMQNAELNFVDAKDPADAQTGAGGPWLKVIRDLFPFKINRLQIHDGSIHFRSYQKQKPVDVYLSQLEASVDNLTNIHDEITPMVTTVTASALAMDQAKLDYKMKLNPFSYRPTFHMAVRLLNLDVTKINTLALAYGAFDFKRGWFDLVVEVDAKEGTLEGYVKPLFRDLKVFSLTQDIKEDNVLQVFWQGLVGIATAVLKNQPRDQLGTVIPFTGDLSNPRTDMLATIGNVLRNAFIRAYLPKLQSHDSGQEGLEFGPPSLTDPLSVGNP